MTTTRYTIADTATDARSADLGVSLSDNAFTSEAAADAALASLESSGADVSGLVVRELRYSDLVGDELAAADRMIAEIGEEHGAEAAAQGAATGWTEVPAVSWDDLTARLSAAFGVEPLRGHGRTGRDVARTYLAAFNAEISG